MLETQKHKARLLNSYIPTRTDMLVSGFTKNIGAKSSDLNQAVSLFFVTFVIFQPISSAVGRRVGAKNWIPFIMVSYC